MVLGKLSNEHIIVEDQKSGSRLYNRGFYGTPVSGGGLELELIEGFYLMDDNKIKIRKKKTELGIDKLLTYISKREPTFEIKYIVYRDLRQRGHIVKPSNVTDFVVYYPTEPDSPKKQVPNKRQIMYWVQPVSERAEFKIIELIDLINLAENTHKELIIAIVDEEGDLTYYKLSHIKPKGKTSARVQKHKLTGTSMLVEDRVLLWESKLISELRNIGFYGKEIGSCLQLALTESAYLMNKDIINIKLARTNRKISLKQFLQIARKLQPDFDLRLKVYSDLKSQQLAVKTGFKYGTHFRVYEGDPTSEHSEFLVHSIPHDFKTSWEDISRAVRLAHGVRKDMLFGRVSKSGKKVEYINIERVKP